MRLGSKAPAGDRKLKGLKTFETILAVLDGQLVWVCLCFLRICQCALLVCCRVHLWVGFVLGSLGVHTFESVWPLHQSFV